jgi:hypothetical protein
MKKDARKISFSKNVGIRFFEAINSNKAKPIASRLAILKNDLTVDKLYQYAALFAQGTFSKFDRFLYGNPLPKTFETLGNLSSNQQMLVYGDPLKEINWNLLILNQYKTEISLFLKYKSDYENAFLLGDYDKADFFLHKIEQEICCSLWLLENKLLLLEYSDSNEANIEFLSDFNKKNANRKKTNRNILFFANYFSKKVEKKLAVSSYKLEVKQSTEKDVKGKPLSQSLKEYVYFKLDLFEYAQYENLVDVLHEDSAYSIVDRYLTLVKVFKLLLSDNENIKFSQLLSEPLKIQINFLYKNILDDNLVNCLLVLNGSDTKIMQKDLNLKPFDYFITEQYRESLTAFQNLLHKNPNNFDNYQPYLESCIFNNTTLPNNNSDSLQKQILNMMNLYINSKKEDPNLQEVAFKRLSINLSTFNLSVGLNAFFKKDLVLQYAKNYEILSKAPFNVRLYEFFNDKHIGLQYLESLQNRTAEKSQFILFEKAKIDDTFDEFIQQFKQTTIQKTALAQFYQDKQNYERATFVWEEVRTESAHIIPIFELCVQKLFECYVALNRLDDAIHLYVDAWMIIPRLAFKVDCSSIRKKIKDKKYKNVEKSINLALFYDISGKEKDKKEEDNDNETQFIVERFLNTLDCELPSEATWTHFDSEPSKIIYFLNTTCRLEILMHFTEIDGTKERIDERLKICKILMNLDKPKSTIYNEEYQKLTERKIMLDGQQELDESKIYVNEEGLMTELGVEEYEGMYDRFASFAGIKKRGVTLYIFSAHLDSNQISNPLKEAFQEIFAVILDKFLRSKFGISVYLSTRIRHGVFLGEIRPVFERHHLISLKQGDTNKYKDIEFWNKSLKTKDSRLQNILKEQSEKVDLLIAKIIERNFQINTGGEKPEGWFNYGFDTAWYEEQTIILSKTNNYKTFIEEVIKLLWLKTDVVLAGIRHKIENEMKEDFTDILDATHLKLKREMGMVPSELSTNILTCMNDLQHTIQRVSGWFNRISSKVADFYMDKVVNLVEDRIKNNYSAKSMLLKKNIHNSTALKGKFFHHFMDIFVTVVDNAIKHSAESKNEIPVFISIEETTTFLNILILNSFPNLEKAKRCIETVIDMSNIAKEKNSGIAKTVKIIKEDLLDKKNTYHHSINEENDFCVTIKINIKNLIK